MLHLSTQLLMTQSDDVVHTQLTNKLVEKETPGSYDDQSYCSNVVI